MTKFSGSAILSPLFMMTQSKPQIRTIIEKNPNFAASTNYSPSETVKRWKSSHTSHILAY